MNWNLGQILLEKYQIKQVFTSGGMGLVYQVGHLDWGIDLALKRPRDDFAKTPRGVAAFEAEIETWAEIGLHPNIATCYYSRRLEGVPCVFAEYVDGGSLSEWIRSKRLYRGGEEVAISRILSIALQFAWGLSWAHQHGLVHQDVKPGNVLMTMDGSAKVTDFGLARGLPSVASGKAAMGALNVTVAGLTPAYASPEQAGKLRVTRATDIWSWAVSIMEMFMGGILWHSGVVAAETLRDYDKSGRRAPGLPEMPRKLLDLLSRCLERNPENRPDSCDQIADVLTSIHLQEFGEPCDALQPDVHFLAVDALNNRGVSLMDVGRTVEGLQRFQKAADLDPYHPEAVCNYLLALSRNSKSAESVAKQRIEHMALEFGHDAHALKILGLTMCGIGQPERGKQLLQAAQKHLLEKVQKIEPPVISIKRDHYFLAQPRSGKEHIADASRFKRLLSKAERAIRESKPDDASRYLQMASEIPGYKRHQNLASLRLLLTA